MDLLASLEALCQRAEREGTLIWQRYYDLWWTPDGLRKENANGRFRWGVQNFTLRDPSEKPPEDKADST